MSILSVLRGIFLDENKQDTHPSSPRNLTSHYRVELRHVEDGEVNEICVGSKYHLLEDEIEQYKYHSNRHISTDLVEVLSKCVEVSDFFHEYDDWVVVPIPMHWSRYILRGFDHTHRIAREFAMKTGLTCSTLLSTKWRRRQSNLPREKRIENKKNSFSLRYGYTLPSHVILIDDVISSGSTLHEAAKVLKAAGVKVVICFVIASNA